MNEWNTPGGERVKGALLGFVGGAVWVGPTKESKP
jgi:hypothetical protein